MNVIFMSEEFKKLINITAVLFFSIGLSACEKNNKSTITASF